MKIYIAFAIMLSYAYIVRAEPIRCNATTTPPTADTCKITYFDRVDNLIFPAFLYPKALYRKPKTSKESNPYYVTAIRGAGTKILYSGTILDADLSKFEHAPICSSQDWRIVAMARESSNILIYGPADVSEFCQSATEIVAVLPVTVIWAELYPSKANLGDPLRKPLAPISLPLSDAPRYCDGINTKTWHPKFNAETDIRPCDRFSWIKFMYNPPAGPIYNSWTQPGASQGTISYTPGIGKVPNTTNAPAGEKRPSQTLTFDVQEYPSQRWGFGYIGFPITFEKANTATSNLNSLIFGISYDVPLAATHPASGSGNGTIMFFRPPDFRIQYGPELAVETPHDLNVTGSVSARLPIVTNIARQPSVVTIFPAVGFEAGNHVVSHTINGLQPTANPIFRFVYGWDSSLRVPFVLTHAFLGDKPTTIDFAWRTRRLFYPEPFTDYVSGVVETLATHPMSYWRGSWIVPFSQLAQFKVTAQHGGLPPDFDYLGYSVSVGLTLGNPGYSEH